LRVDGRSSINFGGVSVSDKFLREHPDAMGRFLKATWRGLRFFKTNRKGAVVIFAKFLNLRPRNC
jgi:ABC-type nitrate/sulfonate/bicarbonate transport system substrate-binding protein